MDELSAIQACLNGREEAERDIDEGRLAIITFVGLGGGDGGAYILKERYGIESKLIIGCLRDAIESEHAKGFNEIMTAEIERRFGPGVLEKAREEAVAKAKANYKPEPPMSNWHALWLIPLLAIVLVLSAALWPLSHIVAWIRRRIRGDAHLRYSFGPNSSIRHWYDHLLAFIGGVMDRFLG